MHGKGEEGTRPRPGPISAARPANSGDGGAAESAESQDWGPMGVAISSWIRSTDWRILVFPSPSTSSTSILRV